MADTEKQALLPSSVNTRNYHSTSTYTPPSRPTKYIVSDSGIFGHLPSTAGSVLTPPSIALSDPAIPLLQNKTEKLEPRSSGITRMNRLILAFLLLNTFLAGLLVYNLDRTAYLSAPNVERYLCLRPPAGLFNDDGKEHIGTEEYGKYKLWEETWRACMEEVKRRKEWREWIWRVVVPIMAGVELAVGVGWWWSLGKEEEGQEEQRRVENWEKTGGGFV
ncbi:hypothetical protein ABW19_dt0206346 [Dactylella cylindrospora]|nr:hypothetical protein ABW19_dt0206346 [Dactylella cylindrospora]